MHFLLPSFLAFLTAAAAPAGLDTARIEQLTGVRGTLDPKEGVFRVAAPRDDLAVDATGVRITPPLGLTSWAAFQQAGSHVMVMGDMVLLEGQVGPVMSVALENGLEVTALHNHFLAESPRVMFMHVGGTGGLDMLAAAVGKVFARIRETRGVVPAAGPAAIDPARTSLDPSRIEAVLGHRGNLSGGVYKITIGRSVRMAGHTAGSAMGVNTWAAFAGSDERAVVAGDFAVLETELQGVLKALRGAGVDVVAIHNHMTGETPRMVFLHYWALGRTEGLARALRAALDRTATDR